MKVTQLSYKTHDIFLLDVGEARLKNLMDQTNKSRWGVVIDSINKYIPAARTTHRGENFLYQVDNMSSIITPQIFDKIEPFEGGTKEDPALIGSDESIIHLTLNKEGYQTIETISDLTDQFKERLVRHALGVYEYVALKGTS